MSDTAEDELAKSSNAGRPTDYEPEFCQRAAELCLSGATDDEIAEEFGVSTRTIYRWKNNFPEFRQAIQAGKEHADARVERAMYQMATGCRVVEKQAIKVKKGQHVEAVEIVEVERYYPPEVNAASLWLRNRKGWSDKTQQEQSGNIQITWGKAE